MTKLYVIEYYPPKGDPVPCTMHEMIVAAFITEKNAENNLKDEWHKYTTNPSEYKIATYQRVEE
jgi:hypothetical protein